MTIEERAYNYSQRDFDGFYTGFERAEKEAYIAGATDQHKEDLENAVAWIKRHGAHIESFGDRLYGINLEHFIEGMKLCAPKST